MSQAINLGRGSGDAAGASLFCAGEPGGVCADGVRSGADGRVFGGCSACSVGGSGVVLGVCAEGGDEGGAAARGGAGGGFEPGEDEVEATVQLEFESWGKLQMALAAGSQQMNLLQTVAGAAANGSGGVGSGAGCVERGVDGYGVECRGYGGCGVQRWELVAVDVDYVGQVGFVGSGVSAAYVRPASDVASDVNYVRRVTLNVGQVVGIAAGVLQLGAPLLAGAPAAGMQVSAMAGFVDREGGELLSGVVGAVLDGWRAGGPGALLLSAAAGDAGVGGDGGGFGGAAGAVEAGGGVSCAAGDGCERWCDGVCFRSYLPG